MPAPQNRSLETRSFSAATMAVPSPRQAGQEGLSPWLEPMRLARAFRDHLLFWGMALGVCGGVLGLAAGVLLFQSTWKISGSLQLVQASTPFDAGKEGESYKPPELHPKEMQSLLEQQFIFERLLPLMDSSQSLQEFRRRFEVVYTRDANVFQVTFSGASTPDRAEEVLDGYFQIVLSTARDLLLSRTQKDLDYFKRQVDEADRELKLVLGRLDELRRQQGFVYLEQEITNQQTKVGKLEESLQTSRTRLDDIEYQVSELPRLIAQLPKELQVAFREQPEINVTLINLRNEIRKLETLYTDDHPRLKAARAELAQLEGEYERQLEEMKQANTAPNPLVDKLEEQLRMAQLQLPQLQREVADQQAKLADAQAYLERLPAMSASYLDLETQRLRQEDMVKRTKARLSEIEISRNLSLNTVHILDPPNAQNALRFSKLVKVLLAGVALLTAGVTVASLLAGVLSLRDRRIRTLEDCVQILGAERVAVIPATSDAGLSEHRRWLQDICGHLSHSRRRFLMIPGPDPVHSRQLLVAIAAQFGASGMVTLVIADVPMQPGEIGHETGQHSGVSHVISQSATLADSCREIAANVHLMEWGDIEDLFNRLPSGDLERGLAQHLESIGGYDVLIILPPSSDLVLMRRLAPLSEALVLMIDPDDSDGGELLDIIASAGRPVAMGILTA
jgi:uncharacterized protein involved in exopolysaccharide biosynthesis